ncbi:RNA-guided endonuclease InsQ/TnpB family protein [Streptomyces sp. NPDC051913]|uniref:RNA-guided endonuclease InsQ/TnpB family protein n=1 Tax=Streptomyces sp. NPDC051913 TaxID=3365676 RepID=UPI0037CE48F7
MIRAYKFLLRPTARQRAARGEMLADHCSLYNGALQERRDAHRHTSKTTVRYGDQSAELKEIRAFDPERQGRWSFSSQQATLRRLDKAFQALFRRVKTVSVKREGNRWYVVLSCDNVPVEELPPSGTVVGVDLGVTHFLTTSDGGHVANPRFPTAMAEALAEGQRHLATFPKRTRQRTKRHRAAARKVAELHARIRRQRADFHGHDVIAHERLNTAGMTKSPAPKADPEQPGSFLPNGAAAKAGLNRSILDAGWAQFLQILVNKAESAGRLVVPVDAPDTSETA